LALVISLFVLPAAHANRVILLTGYWQPTNEMLRAFSNDSRHNPAAWVGKNWENSGYDIYAYFPEFHGDSIGEGDFRVDFASSFNDFIRLTSELKPIAIISFGQGGGPWEIETKFPAYYQLQFQSGHLSSQVGEPTRYPIPLSLQTNQVFYSTLPAAGIQQSVQQSKAPHLEAWIDSKNDAGDFLCGFMGYLGAWYQSEHASASDPDHVMATGFIHVNGGLEKSKSSLDATLRALIRALP
jgi:pyrrolidone-carboxylate peptidase